MASIELTEEQQRQLAVASEKLPQVVDPAKSVYVLVPAEEYESIREMLEDERQRSAIHAVALRNAVGRMDEAP